MTIVKSRVARDVVTAVNDGAAAAEIDAMPADAGRAMAIQNETALDALLQRLPFAAEPPLTPVGIDHVNLSVRSIDRSIAFYARVFGFRVVEDGRHERRPYVIMTATGHAYLALHEDSDLSDEHTADATRQSPWHWSFVVGDIESARASLWNLGVAVSVDSGEPDQVHRWKRSCSLYVDDPDGHRIELVEVWGGGLSSP